MGRFHIEAAVGARRTAVAVAVACLIGAAAPAAAAGGAVRDGAGRGEGPAASSIRLDPVSRRILPAETIPAAPAVQVRTVPLFPYGAPGLYLMMSGDRSHGAEGAARRRATPQDLNMATVRIDGDGVARVGCGDAGRTALQPYPSASGSPLGRDGGRHAQ